VRLRGLQPGDVPALAELMLDAYRGTIDDEGETLEDALNEVKAFLAGERGGKPYPDLSILCFAGDRLVSACLVGEWQSRRQPIIAYLLTLPTWKRRGLARLALMSALQALKEQGYTQVRAVITRGNVPSEQLFTSLGFTRVAYDG
jgi:RimJ/RimL family protein N-acetyltransferase